LADLSGGKWLYLITWVGIVMSPTYSFANDKFKYSHEIIVNKIEESLNFVENFEQVILVLPGLEQLTLFINRFTVY